MENYKKGDTTSSIENNADYIIEKRINPEDCILFFKDMKTDEFSYLEKKYITSQLKNNNLYFLINWYLLWKRNESKLRKIYALWFDVDTLKEWISDKELFTRLDEIEEEYWLRAHIINKTWWWYHIYYLMEKTPYLPFKKEFDKIYEELMKDLWADADFSWKVWILKVVWWYDFRRKWWISNIRNDFHNSYKITDFSKIIWDEIFKKYEKFNFKEEFRKIDEEELNLKKRINTYVYKINDIPFPIILEKLNQEGFKITIINNRVHIEGNEWHGKALYYHDITQRLVDYARNNRIKIWETSRGWNYGFLYYIFSIANKLKNKDLEIIKDKKLIKDEIRKFVWKYFNIYYRNPDKYINTNKLIYNEFLNQKISFNEEDKNFLLENNIINSDFRLSNISKFVLLNILKISEIDMSWNFQNKTIYDLLSNSSLKESNIKKQNKKFKIVLFWLSKIYKDINSCSKDSEKVRVFLIANLIEEKHKYSFNLLKNYFKLERYEKYIYRWISIDFINNKNLKIEKLDLYFYLLNRIINKTEKTSLDRVLKKFWGQTYLTNKSIVKTKIMADIKMFKTFISTTNIKIEIWKNMIIFSKKESGN